MVGRIDGCIELLRRNDDEGKIAGLLVLSKLHERGEEITDADLRCAGETLGSAFLRRMLQRGSPRSLAVGIIHVLCRDQVLSKQWANTLTIPLVDCIFDKENTEELSECLFPGWCAVRALTRSNFDRSRDECFIVFNYAIHRLLAAFLEDHCKKFDDALVAVIREEVADICIPLNMYPHSILSDMLVNENCWMFKLSSVFASNQRTVKFELLCYLDVLMRSMPEKVLMNSDLQDIPRWSISLRAGIFDVLRGRVQIKWRLAALNLSLSCFSIVGHRWALLCDSSGTIFSTLTSVVTVEGRVLLESLCSTNVEESSEEFELLCASLQLSNRLCECLLLEDCADDDRKCFSMSGDAFISLHSRFCDLLRAIFTFLRELELCDNLSIVHTKALNLSIELIGRWLSEDTESFRDELCTALPMVLSNGDHQALEFLFPCIAELALDDSRWSCLSSCADSILDAACVSARVGGDDFIHDFELASTLGRMLNCIYSHEIAELNCWVNSDLIEAFLRLYNVLAERFKGISMLGRDSDADPLINSFVCSIGSVALARVVLSLLQMLTIINDIPSSIDTQFISSASEMIQSAAFSEVDDLVEACLNYLPIVLLRLDGSA